MGEIVGVFRPACNRRCIEEMGNLSLPARAKGCTKFRSIEKNDLRIWSLYQCDFDLLQLFKENNLVLVLEFVEFEMSVGTYRFHLAVLVFLHKTCIP